MKDVLIIDDDPKRRETLEKEIEKLSLNIKVRPFRDILDEEQIQEPDDKIRQIRDQEFIEIERADSKFRKYLHELEHTILLAIHCTQWNGEAFANYCEKMKVPVIKYHGTASPPQKSKYSFRYPKGVTKSTAEEINFKRFFDAWGKTDYDPSKVKEYWRLLLPEKEVPIFYEFASLDILIQGLLTIIGLEKEDPWSWTGEERKDLPNISEAKKNPEFRRQLEIIKKWPCRWFLECWPDIQALFPDGPSNKIIKQRINEISDIPKKKALETVLFYPDDNDSELISVAKAVMKCKIACQIPNPEKDCPPTDVQSCPYCPPEAINILVKKADDGSRVNLIKAHEQYVQLFKQ